MRNVICALNVSIDGCYDHTRLNGDEELHAYFAELMKDVDLGITGRKMYELMNPYWAERAKTSSGVKGTDDFAERITRIESMVISRTMEELPGGPRILRGNLEEEVRRLKAMPGKKISVGGMTVRSQLMAAGLIDELYVVIQPAITGSGPRLFNDFTLDNVMPMKLEDVKVMKSGCVGLHYVKR